MIAAGDIGDFRVPVKGLSALVIGTGSGIGDACARLFAASGGLVAVADRNADAAETVARTIVAGGGRAIAVAADVARKDDVDRAVRRTIDSFQRLDVLINAAARIGPDPLEMASFDTWRLLYQVNVEGALLAAQAALPHLRKSPAPAIVHIGTVGAAFGRPNAGAYGSSKAALISLTKQMALEWAGFGIRANIVNPGLIATPLAMASISPEARAKRQQDIPARRMGNPGEVASLIVYLASPAATYITGQVVNCDGGLSVNVFMGQGMEREKG